MRADTHEGREREQQHILESLARAAAHAAFDAESAQWKLFSSAQRLFADGVALCLGMLTLADFNSAAQTCKNWRTGATHVKSLGGTVAVSRVAEGRLGSLATSPYRHLIAGLTDLGSHIRSTGFGVMRLWPRKWSPASLCVLSQQLAGLRSIRLQLDLAQFEDPSAVVAFPPRLQSAEFDLGLWTLKDTDVECSLDATSLLRGLLSCAWLTRLEMRIIKGDIPVDLTALADLQQLQDLTICGCIDTHFTAAALEAIKTMPLSSLSLLPLRSDANDDGLWEMSWLDPLTEPPHALERSLQSFAIHSLKLFEDMMDRLSSMRSLTALTPDFIAVGALPDLESFTKLRTLHLTFDGDLDLETHDGQDDDDDPEAYALWFDELDRVRAAAFLPHLVHCSLTALKISSASFAEGDLVALCNSQPALQQLELDSVDLSEVRGFAPLTQLERLTIKELWTALSEQQQIALKPPSALLPRLSSFQYSSRD